VTKFNYLWKQSENKVHKAIRHVKACSILLAASLKHLMLKVTLNSLANQSHKSSDGTVKKPAVVTCRATADLPVLRPWSVVDGLSDTEGTRWMKKQPQQHDCHAAQCPQRSNGCQECH
jgi:hypothetical protein